MAATAGLPSWPVALAAPAPGAAPAAPAVPLIDFAYVTLEGGRVRMTATVRAPVDAEVSLSLPGPAEGLKVTPESAGWLLDGEPGGPAALALRLAAGKAVVTVDVTPVWEASGPWSWTPLTAVSPSPQGAFRAGGLVARGKPASYVVGEPLPGQGFLARGPGVPLRRWRLSLAGGRVEVYGSAAEPPVGLAEVARLARTYGLFGRDRLVLLDLHDDATVSETADLATRFWGTVLNWDLGDDQEGWLRGAALLSLAATAATPEDYLEVLAGDLLDQAARAGTDDRGIPRGEALALALNQTLRERTEGRAGLDDVLRYLGAYGAGGRLDAFGLRQAATAAVARNLDDFFDHHFGPPPVGPSAPPEPPPDGTRALLAALLTDADKDGRPDFIAREAEALRRTAEAESAAQAGAAVPVLAPAFVEAGEVNPGAAAPAPAPKGRRVAYLTFDDGPSAVTHEVLRVLHEYGVPATFFVIGNRVKVYADTVRQMVKDGHAVGNHTYDHDAVTVYKSPKAFLASLKRADGVIAGVAGVRPGVVRAPGGTKGHFTREYYTLLAESGYTVYDWDVSSADTDASHPGPEVIAANVLAGAKGRRWPVILMHDGPGHEATAQALPAIIRGLRDEGYEFGTLPK